MGYDMYIISRIKNLMFSAEYPEEKARAIMNFLDVTIKNQEWPSPLPRGLTLAFAWGVAINLVGPHWRPSTYMLKEFA